MWVIHWVHRFPSYRWSPPSVSVSSCFPNRFHSMFFSSDSTYGCCTFQTHLNSRSRWQSQQSFSFWFSQQDRSRSCGSYIFSSFPWFKFYIEDHASHWNLFQRQGAPNLTHFFSSSSSFFSCTYSTYLNSLPLFQSICCQDIRIFSFLVFFPLNQGQSCTSVWIILNSQNFSSSSFSDSSRCRSWIQISQQSFLSSSSMSNRNSSSVVSSRFLSFPFS